jgi:carbamoyltransferase
MDMQYFWYCQGLVMTSPAFDDLFGGPPRKPESPLRDREMDLAASVQKVIEEIMLRAAVHVHEVTGLKNLCLAGGICDAGRGASGTTLATIWGGRRRDSIVGIVCA